MNNVWVVVVKDEVYGIAENRLAAYLMLKTYVRTLNGTPRAIAKNILDITYERDNLASFGINASTYAKSFHITKVEET